MRTNAAVRVSAATTALIGALLVSTLVQMDGSANTYTSPPGFEFSAPAGWIEADSYAGMRTWTGDAARKQFVSVIADDSMKNEIPAPDDAVLIRNVESASLFPNWIAGISDWKIDRIERHAHPQGQRLVLVGTYLNSKNELIRFEEWKFFLSSGYAQISYSELAGSSSFDRSGVAEVLKRYRPFGL